MASSQVDHTQQVTKFITEKLKQDYRILYRLFDYAIYTSAIIDIVHDDNGWNLYYNGAKYKIEGFKKVKNEERFSHLINNKDVLVTEVFIQLPTVTVQKIRRKNTTPVSYSSSRQLSPQKGFVLVPEERTLRIIMQAVPNNLFPPSLPQVPTTQEGGKFRAKPTSKPKSAKPKATKK